MFIVYKVLPKACKYKGVHSTYIFTIYFHAVPGTTELPYFKGYQSFANDIQNQSVFSPFQILRLLILTRDGNIFPLDVDFLPTKHTQ